MINKLIKCSHGTIKMFNQAISMAYAKKNRDSEYNQYINTNTDSWKSKD